MQKLKEMCMYAKYKESPVFYSKTSTPKCKWRTGSLDWDLYGDLRVCSPALNQTNFIPTQQQSSIFKESNYMAWDNWKQSTQ
jgi:hypothetical protein